MSRKVVVVKCRKPKKCDYCGDTIEKGKNYARVGSKVFHPGQCYSKYRKTMKDRLLWW